MSREAQGESRRIASLQRDLAPIIPPVGGIFEPMRNLDVRSAATSGPVFFGREICKAPGSTICIEAGRCTRQDLHEHAIRRSGVADGNGHRTDPTFGFRW